MTIDQGLKVTQEDRDAAAEQCLATEAPVAPHIASIIRAGRCDHHELVQEAARHRLASSTPSPSLPPREAIALVERLRELLAKASKGPWHVKLHGHVVIIASADLDEIAQLNSWTGVVSSAGKQSRYYAEANARLLVEAKEALPKLLSLLPVNGSREVVAPIERLNKLLAADYGDESSLAIDLAETAAQLRDAYLAPVNGWREERAATVKYLRENFGDVAAMEIERGDHVRALSAAPGEGAAP